MAGRPNRLVARQIPRTLTFVDAYGRFLLLCERLALTLDSRQRKAAERYFSGRNWAAKDGW